MLEILTITNSDASEGRQLCGDEQKSLNKRCFLLGQQWRWRSLRRLSAGFQPDRLFKLLTLAEVTIFHWSVNKLEASQCFSPGQFLHSSVVEGLAEVTGRPQVPAWRCRGGCRCFLRKISGLMFPAKVCSVWVNKLKPGTLPLCRASMNSLQCQGDVQLPQDQRWPSSVPHICWR